MDWPNAKRVAQLQANEAGEPFTVYVMPDSQGRSPYCVALPHYRPSEALVVWTAFPEGTC